MIANKIPAGEVIVVNLGTMTNLNFVGNISGYTDRMKLINVLVTNSDGWTLFDRSIDSDIRIYANINYLYINSTSSANLIGATVEAVFLKYT